MLFGFLSAMTFSLCCINAALTDRPTPLLIGPALLRLFLGDQVDDFIKAPDVVCDPRLHGRRDPERPVDAAEIVVHEVQADRVHVVLDLLAEPVG